MPVRRQCSAERTPMHLAALTDTAWEQEIVPHRPPGPTEQANSLWSFRVCGMARRTSVRTVEADTTSASWVCRPSNRATEARGKSWSNNQAHAVTDL